MAIILEVMAIVVTLQSPMLTFSKEKASQCKKKAEDFLNDFYYMRNWIEPPAQLDFFAYHQYSRTRLQNFNQARINIREALDDNKYYKDVPLVLEEFGQGADENMVGPYYNYSKISGYPLQFVPHNKLLLPLWLYRFSKRMEAPSRTTLQTSLLIRSTIIMPMLHKLFISTMVQA